MRKRNKVAALHRTPEHRKAMLSNMVTSLLYHEQIQSTTAKAKAARILTEKLITRAKRNLQADIKDDQKIHNMRLVEKVIHDQEVLSKLFNDIAPRFQTRAGGYTRVIKLGRRRSDNSEMAIVELVDRKQLAQLKDERKEVRESLRKGKGEKQKPAAAEPEKDKKTAKKEAKAAKKAEKDRKKVKK